LGYTYNQRKERNPMTKTYQVEGMTCEHCAASVREEVGEIAGVTKVDVDVASGQVAVSGSDFTDAQVSAAVSEAGYSVKA